MLNLLPAILISMAGLTAGIGPTTVEVISISDVVAWFKDNLPTDRNPTVIAVTLRQDNKADGVRLVQGFFNTDKEEFVKVRTLDGKSLDSELAEIHQTHRVTVWK